MGTEHVRAEFHRVKMKTKDLVVPFDEGAVRFRRSKNPMAHKITMGLTLEIGDEQIEIGFDNDDVAKLKLWLSEYYTDPFN